MKKFSMVASSTGKVYIPYYPISTTIVGFYWFYFAYIPIFTSRLLVNILMYLDNKAEASVISAQK